MLTSRLGDLLLRLALAVLLFHLVSLVVRLIYYSVAYVEQGISQVFGVPGYVVQFGWVMEVLSALDPVLLLVELLAAVSAVILEVVELLKPISEKAYRGTTA